jgi:hypothetical protein
MWKGVKMIGNLVYYGNIKYYVEKFLYKEKLLLSLIFVPRVQ